MIASQRTISEYSKCLRNLLTGLADESIHTAIVCPPRGEIASIVPPSIEIIQHPAFELPLCGYYNRNLLVERLEKLNINVLHCLCESKAGFVRWLSRQLAIPYVLTVNSMRSKYFRLSISPRRCASILTPAETIADSVASSRKKFADRIEQINFGIFTEKTSNCFGHINRLAGIVIASPIDDVADFENLFGALKHLAIDGHEFMIVLIGSGRAEKKLWHLLNKLGLLRMVTFVPRPHSTEAVLKAGDIFIRPKPSKVFNPLLLEAMSVGAAVASCTGGVDDLIIDEQTAVTFDPTDEISIYDCLKRLFDNRNEARKIAKNGQKHLKKNHSVSAMVSATLQNYQDARQWFKS